MTDTNKAASGAASQPEALRLADALAEQAEVHQANARDWDMRPKDTANWWYYETCRDAAAQLRRLHALTTAAPAAQEAEPALDDSEVDDLARSAFETAMSYGVDFDAFRRLAMEVRRRCAAPRPQADAGAAPTDADTVDVVGVRASGEHVNLGKMPMPPTMKARDIATSQFGGFQDGDGSDAEMCFGALEELLAWLIAQGWGAAAPAQEAELRAEVDRLNAIINTPQADDFLRAVSTEAEHQRQRWPSEHDEGKAPADWFWLVGYLAGKALHAHAAGNAEKAEHHIITTAAALANWHLAVFGKTNMRPGIDAARARQEGGSTPSGA
ncbi:hypothetical protein Acf1_00019 [Acidovorax phage ACF1]|nr:hypothetical protein Acf1_00019 [Acidovorax phage ACF1]